MHYITKHNFLTGMDPSRVRFSKLFKEIQRSCFLESDNKDKLEFLVTGCFNITTRDFLFSKGIYPIIKFYIGGGEGWERYFSFKEFHYHATHR